jgi:hypothetical protein
MTEADCKSIVSQPSGCSVDSKHLMDSSSSAPLHGITLPPPPIAAAAAAHGCCRRCPSLPPPLPVAAAAAGKSFQICYIFVPMKTLLFF